MHNMTMKMSGSKLVIEVDLSAKKVGAASPSASGKTLLVATSGGAEKVPGCSIDGLKVALNVTVPNPNRIAA